MAGSTAVVCLAAQNWGKLREISLERTPCFGACPVYKVTIRRDGTLLYHGRRFVDRLGDFRARVRPSEMRRLERALNDLGYWSMKPKYDAQALTFHRRLCRSKRRAT